MDSIDCWFNLEKIVKYRKQKMRPKIIELRQEIKALTLTACLFYLGFDGFGKLVAFW